MQTKRDRIGDGSGGWGEDEGDDGEARVRGGVMEVPVHDERPEWPTCRHAQVSGSGND